MAARAVALMECMADAQTARNAAFPDAVTSPVVGLLMMAFSMALDLPREPDEGSPPEFGPAVDDARSNDG